MEKNHFIIGVDIGGTNTVIGLVDHRGACVVQSKFPTTAQRTADEFVHTLVSSIQTLRDSIPSETDIAGIGIGAPAARRHDGSIHDPANLSWGSMNLVAMLSGYFSVPIVVVNDSKAAALGELYYGSARGKKNAVVITLGTGMGSGIIVNGGLLEGEKSIAGEIGHVILERNGRKCGCGREGCAETYVSATGLRRTVFELLSYYSIESKCRNKSFHELTAERIHSYAVKGDVIARKAFEKTGEYLGRIIADVAAILDPETVVLTGGLMQAEEFILPAAIESFQRSVLHYHRGQVKIVASQFSDNEGAILGASSLISRKVFTAQYTADQSAVHQ